MTGDVPHARVAGPATDLVSHLVVTPRVPARGGPCHVALRLSCSGTTDLEARRGAVHLSLVVEVPPEGPSQAQNWSTTLTVIDGIRGLLSPDDRVSLVTFGGTGVDVRGMMVRRDQLPVIAPSFTSVDRGERPLHLAWVEGAQVAATVPPIEAEYTPVIVVVASGYAEVGETDPATLARDVGALAATGITTTVVAVGDDVNDDLARVLARAGGGSVVRIASREDLEVADVRASLGIGAPRCRAVRAFFEAAHGVEWTDVDPGPVQEEGAVLLPDVRAGCPVDVVVHLACAPRTDQGPTDLGVWSVVWTDEHGADHEHILHVLGSTDTLDSADSSRASASETASVDSDRATEFSSALVHDAFVERHAPSWAPEWRSHRPEGADELVDEVMFTRGDGTTYLVRVARGDVTNVEAGALLNPSNPWLHGAGRSVDGAVHRRAGMDLTRACREIGHVPVGQSVVTPGFALPVDFVVHAAVPVFEGDAASDRLLASCYRSALALVATMRVRTVATPIMGIGTNGFPARQGVRVAIEEIFRFQSTASGVDVVSIVVQQEDVARLVVAAIHDLGG